MFVPFKLLGSLVHQKKAFQAKIKPRCLSTGFKKPNTLFDELPTQDASVKHISNHYISIVPPLQTLDRLVSLQEQLKPTNSRIHWKGRYNLVLHLLHLGDKLYDNKQVELAKKIAEDIISGVDSFDVSLEKICALPRWNRPRELAVTMSNGDKQLKHLKRRLEDAMIKEGILKEDDKKPYRPNIALGYWNDIYVMNYQCETLKEEAESIGGVIVDFKVRDVLLMNSSLDPEKPIYTPVHMMYTKNSVDEVKMRTRYKYKN